MQKMNVGERIRYFRLVRGWSQETLALEADINTAFVGHLERGLKSPTINTLEKITEALGITLEELFSEKLFSNEQDKVRQIAIARIEYSLQKLGAEEVELMSDIVSDIVKLKSVSVKLS